MKHLFHLLYALSLLAFVSCTTTPVQSPATFTLSWEKGHPERKEWTDLTASLVRENLSTFSNASDVTEFCPKYKQLDDNGKVHVWSELVSSISKFESAWNPASRYVEKSMGTDLITGKKVVSEGLLQLSYQDEKNYPDVAACKDFNWSADKNLADNDPNKTILSARINLNCGIGILVQLVKRKGVIAQDSPYRGAPQYWSVTRGGSSHHKSEIIAMVQKGITSCL